ncbi:MAG: hypothetical protein V1863_04400 [Candidatus Omnitrophota bacterium]
MKKLSLFKAGFKRKSGTIIFMAAGAIAVLSILVLGTTSSVTQALKLARRVTDTETCAYIASSVARVMRVVFASDATPVCVTVYDLRDREIPFGDKTAFVSFKDEQSKINIDLAPKEVLLRLPTLSGDKNLVDAIVAANIAVQEELLLIEGMTREIYDELKEITTAHGIGTINIHTATEGSLYALGMDSDLVNKIQAYLAGDDGELATLDDKIFSSVIDIVPSLAPYGLTAEQASLLQSLIATGQLGTTTDRVRFEIVVKKNERVLKTYSIVVAAAGGQIVGSGIVSWSEV